MFDSVWKSTVKMPKFPPLDGDTKTDVLIVGGGLAGILTAYAMEQAGIDCLLIEADEICHGVTRNTTAKITSQHGLIYYKLLKMYGPQHARLYWQANEMALEQYRKMTETIPCDFQEKDNYIYSIDRPELLEQELAALNKLGIPAEYADRLPLPFPVAGAIRFHRQAQFHPLKFVAGVARALKIREHTAALEFREGSVLTERGHIRANHIIVATHFPLINKHGSYFLKMHQDRSYVLALEGGPQLDGMYLDEAEEGLSFRNYGSMLLLGGGSHRTGKRGGGWSVLKAFAREYYPDARESLRWATQDCMTLDQLAYIGPYSARTKGLYVATGFHKWGMTTSMLAGMLLCDAVQGKKHPWSLMFSPSRTMLRPQLLTNVLEAATNLLTLSAPRCPHMGCALKWNPREHSWDCPCHGSRFDRDGTLLDNPATGSMNVP